MELPKIKPRGYAVYAHVNVHPIIEDVTHVEYTLTAVVILIVDSGAFVDHVLLLLCGVFCRMGYLLLLSVQPERLQSS